MKSWFKQLWGHIVGAEIYTYAPQRVKEPQYEQPLHTPEEQYCLGLLTEECGEINQMVGKAFRFGLDTPGRKGADGQVDMSITPRTELAKECGDILAAIEFAKDHRLLDPEIILHQYVKKYAKLTDPAVCDNLGRPLAPQRKPYLRDYEGDDD